MPVVPSSLAGALWADLNGASGFTALLATYEGAPALFRDHTVADVSQLPIAVLTVTETADPTAAHGWITAGVDLDIWHAGGAAALDLLVQEALEHWSYRSVEPHANTPLAAVRVHYEGREDEPPAAGETDQALRCTLRFGARALRTL